MWNYRVVLDNGVWTVKEVYYSKRGKVIGWCDATLCGADYEELKDNFMGYADAYLRPALKVKGGKLKRYKHD